MTTVKTIAITGASRGIGKACAIRLAAPNVALVLMARNEAELLAVAETCESKGATVYVLALDLAKVDEIKDHIEHMKSVCGPIHTLINNAGIWIEQPFLDGNMAAWDMSVDVNLKAVMHLTRYTLEGMPEGGSMVFIASTASKRTYAKGTNYCAVKHGMLGFAGALFEDIRERGIKVCSIFPGVVNTDMHADDPSFDKAKMIQPEDIADAVAFVISTPANICPTELIIQPQKQPKKR